MAEKIGICPRCGIATFALRRGQAQPCRDCRSVDPRFTSQYPSVRERTAALRAQK